MVVAPSSSSSTATLQVWYYIGGYWKFPCTVQVNLSDAPCGDYWTGNATAVANGKSVQLTNLTVIVGATQANVTGLENWADVKLAGAIATAQATTVPDNEDAWAQILWTGGDAGASANQRNVDKSISAMTTVTAQIGTVVKSLNIWIIWSTLTIRISGTLSIGNDAKNLVAGNVGSPPNFQDGDGGGDALGPIDCKGTPKLTYAYTIGRMEASGYLQPDGIENVIAKTAWKIRRNVTGIGWDNGGHYVGGTWMAGPSFNKTNQDDTSNSDWMDLDPTSGLSTRNIYDTDIPGCSAALKGTTINRTSETYANFTQWITVTLDSEKQCSDNSNWSYKAQVDGDKGTVDANALDTAWITIPNSPKYGKRN